jgi:hypothetical protein
MKYLATILLATLLVTATDAQAPDFAGSWRLDRDRSEDLTGRLANAEFVLEVTRQGAELIVEEKIRIRGRWQPSTPRTYRLDGRQTTAEVSRPLAGTMELEARLLGKAGPSQNLELKSTISGDNLGSPVTLITREFWELTDGGKSLKILRQREIGPQSQQSVLLFTRE